MSTDTVDTVGLIRNAIVNMVSNLLYYDRQDDKSLPIGSIDEAINDGLITQALMVAIFRAELSRQLKKLGVQDNV